jgi:hypothetical protein
MSVARSVFLLGGIKSAARFLFNEKTVSPPKEVETWPVLVTSKLSAFSGAVTASATSPCPFFSQRTNQP